MWGSVGYFTDFNIIHFLIFIFDDQINIEKYVWSLLKELAS